MKFSVKKIAVVLAFVMVFTACEAAFAWSWSDLNPTTWSRKAIIGTCVGIGIGVYTLGRGAYRAYAAPEGKGTDEFIDGCKDGAKEAWDVVKIFW